MAPSWASIRRPICRLNAGDDVSTSRGAPDSASTQSTRPTAGSEASRGSRTRTATTSCRRASTDRLVEKSRAQKSETRKTVALRLSTEPRRRRGSFTSVPRPSGRNVSSSRIRRSTWLRPLAGGMYISTRSLNRTSPTLSLFEIAANASTPQSSAATSTFVRPPLPNSPLRLRSTARMTVSSRSSS